MNAAGLAAVERSAAMAVDCVWEAAALAGMGWWDDAAGRLTEATVRVSAARHAFGDEDRSAPDDRAAAVRRYTETSDDDVAGAAALP